MTSRFHEGLPEGQGQGQGQEQAGYVQEGQGQGMGGGMGGMGQAQFDSQSIHSTSTAQTLVQPPMAANKVYLSLEQVAELPSVPYKLRHALTASEWDRRMEIISKWNEKSTQPGIELIYFLIFCVVIPGGIAYPIFRLLLRRNGRVPWGYAMIISSSISLGMFMLFFTPMLVRKWVLQRRMNKDVQRWADDDMRKHADKSIAVRWRVRLPYIFCASCYITIPVPPRPDDAPSTLHSRQNSAEQAVMGGLPRGDSNNNRSMFENA